MWRSLKNAIMRGTSSDTDWGTTNNTNRKRVVKRKEKRVKSKESLPATTARLSVGNRQEAIGSRQLAKRILATKYIKNK